MSYFLKEAEEYFNNLPQKVKDKFTIAFLKPKMVIKAIGLRNFKTLMVFLNLEEEININFIEYLHFGIQILKKKL